MQYVVEPSTMGKMITFVTYACMHDYSGTAGQALHTLVFFTTVLPLCIYTHTHTHTRLGVRVHTCGIHVEAVYTACYVNAFNQLCTGTKTKQ